MWLHSGLFQMCLFVAYSVKIIYNVEIIPERLYKSKEDNFKDIINRASSLLNKYYLLKSEYTGNYTESDYEEIPVVNELKKRLKEATIYREDKNNDPPQKIFEINSFENKISNLIKKYNDINQQSLENQEGLYEDLQRWPINTKTFSRETSIKFSKDLVALVKSLMKKKYFILIYKDRGNKIDRWMKTVLKKYYAPSILFFVLKPISSKSQLILFNDADIFAVKHVKGNQKDILTPNNLEQIKYINKYKNVDVKRKLSKEANNETLRGGCVECAKAQLRKCFKAVRSSIKNSCRTFHCKEGFKRSFKSNSKSACLYEFSDDKKDNLSCGDISKSKNVTLQRSRFRKVKLRKGNAGVCKNSASLRKLNLRDDRQESSSTDTALLNILRNKYEKACERALFKKCNRACSCAIKATCDEFRCIKKKINRMTKDCKTQCKSQFIKYQDSSDESSDSDSSDSGSDEDTSEEDNRSKDQNKKVKN